MPSTTEHHRFATVHGVRVHWTELGESVGPPPLVLLHGLNDCHRTWRQLAPRLALRRRVLMPDLPGHGLSGRPDVSYDLDWYARVMEGWLAAASLERVDVVGHSFGGGVAQMMLLRCPERIRRLVLVSSGGLGREVSIALRLASIPMVVERLGQPFMGPCTHLAMLALRACGYVLTRDDVAHLSAMNAQVGSARAFARTVHGIVDWRGQRHSFLERVGELRRLPPMAVFWGDQDSVIPFSHAEALARTLDGVRVTRFAACGHAPHREQPDAFLAALGSFLELPHVPDARLRQSTADAKAPGRWVTQQAAAE